MYVTGSSVEIEVGNGIIIKSIFSIVIDDE